MIASLAVTCTFCSFARFPETIDSVWDRSSESSRSDSNTSQPRSRCKGHHATVVDLRYSGSIDHALRTTQPAGRRHRVHARA